MSKVLAVIYSWLTDKRVLYILYIIAITVGVIYFVYDKQELIGSLFNLFIISSIYAFAILIPLQPWKEDLGGAEWLWGQR